MLTGLAAPLSFRLMVQSTLPLPSFFDNKARISNSNGLRKAGIFRESSNCFPFSDLISTRNVLSPTVCSFLPKPVIDFNIRNHYLKQYTVNGADAAPLT